MTASGVSFVRAECSLNGQPGGCRESCGPLEGQLRDCGVAAGRSPDLPSWGSTLIRGTTASQNETFPRSCAVQTLLATLGDSPVPGQDSAPAQLSGGRPQDRGTLRRCGPSELGCHSLTSTDKLPRTPVTPVCLWVALSLPLPCEVAMGSATAVKGFCISWLSQGLGVTRPGDCLDVGTERPCHPRHHDAAWGLPGPALAWSRKWRG